MKLGLWLRFVWIVGAYCGCGGGEFEGLGPVPEASVAIEPDPSIVAAMGPDGSAGIAEIDAPFFPTSRPDAGEVLEVDSSSPAADSSAVGPAVNGAPEAAPPPPALCCSTPCSGSSPAAITCGNGPAWMCVAGSCADRACGVGSGCTWMGTCVGRVEPCP